MIPQLLGPTQSSARGRFSIPISRAKADDKKRRKGFIQPSRPCRNDDELD